MSWTERRGYLIAYDVTDPKRLVKLHRFLRKAAVSVQYSVFVGLLSARQMERILDGVLRRMNCKEDDVRCYPLPERCEVLTVGRQGMPPGVVLAVPELAPWMRRNLKREGSGRDKVEA